MRQKEKETSDLVTHHGGSAFPTVSPPIPLFTCTSLKRVPFSGIQELKWMQATREGSGEKAKHESKVV